MSVPSEMVLRFATLWIVMLVPTFQVNVIRLRLRRFRRPTSELPPWRGALEEYRRDTYVAEAGPLVDRLHIWTKLLFGALAVVMLGMIAWNYIDPPRV